MSKINTVCHKRSSVITEGVPKQPTTDQIDYGEIAINYAANGETLYIKNSENAIAEFKDNKYYQKQLSDKQDKLVSGTNIKTVNGESLLGDGNIFIPKVFIDDATDESVAIHSQESDILSSVVFVSPTTHTHFEYTKRSEIVNSLSSTDGTVPLSAKQGKVLSDKLRTGDLIAKEAKTQWGGRNNNEGNLSPIESLLTDSANRLTFGNAEGVTVEYSTDGGSTWNAYTEETDYGKLLHPIYSGTF